MQFTAPKRLLKGQFFLTLLQKARSLIAQNMNVDSFFTSTLHSIKKGQCALLDITLNLGARVMKIAFNLARSKLQKIDGKKSYTQQHFRNEDIAITKT